MKLFFLTALLAANFAHATNYNQSNNQVNDKFKCSSPMFFNRLELEVSQGKETDNLKIKSFDANRAARALGLATDNRRIETLELNMPKSWCIYSKKILGVFSCVLPSIQWPPPTLEITALDDDGKVVAKGNLAHATFGIEHAVRTSAGFDGEDFVNNVLEVSIYMISNDDNAKRARIGLPLRVEDCSAD